MDYTIPYNIFYLTFKQICNYYILNIYIFYNKSLVILTYIHIFLVYKYAYKLVLVSKLQILFLLANCKNEIAITFLLDTNFQKLNSIF